ncbi:MAG: hypothetical protein HGB34_04105, partial [Candidatus Moranbacteria bacterium]|nr:hypothetical protein [Candidatus Moranbacteria bacterium]
MNEIRIDQLIGNAHHFPVHLIRFVGKIDRISPARAHLPSVDAGNQVDGDDILGLLSVFRLQRPAGKDIEPLVR